MGAPSRLLRSLFGLHAAFTTCAVVLWLIHGAALSTRSRADGPGEAEVDAPPASSRLLGATHDAESAAGASEPSELYLAHNSHDAEHVEGDSHDLAHDSHDVEYDLAGDSHDVKHSVVHNRSGTCPSQYGGVDEHDLIDAEGSHGTICKRHHARRLASHGDDNVSQTSMAAGYAVLIFVAFNMSLLYLVNYPDPDVRMVFRHMVCMALCVYCAVLINEALSVLIFEELRNLILWSWNIATGSLGIMSTCVNTEVIILGGALVYLGFVFTLNFRCYRVRENEGHMAANSLLYGHLAAFSGITMFGHLENSHEFKALVERHAATLSGPIWLHVLICVIAAVLLFAMLIFGKLLRWCFLPRASASATLAEWSFCSARDGEAADLMAGEASEPESPKVAAKQSGAAHEERWMHHVLEGEQDATALVMGYLTLDVVTVMIRPAMQTCGLHGCYHADVCDWREVFLMGCVSVMLFVVLVLYCELTMPSRAGSGSECALSCGRLAGRLAHVFHIRMYLAVAMAWCFETTFEWLVLHIGEDWAISSCRLTSALLCTVFAIVASLCTNFGCKGVGVHNRDQDTRADVIHDISAGFAFLVGLAWERAYTATEHMVIMGTPLMKRNPITWTMILSAVLVSIVLPGFVWYVVPIDRMSRDQHVKQIDEERARKLAPRRAHSGAEA